MAQNKKSHQSQDLEKADVGDDRLASQDRGSIGKSASSAAPGGKEKVQVSAASADDGEPGQSLLVEWDGPDDPANPRNWPAPLRWTILIIFSFGGFIAMMSGSMIAPALPALSRDLHMSEASAQLSLSIFILAFGFGPMLLAPFAELYGRRPVWLSCGVFYTIWSIVSGFSQNNGILVASRFLSGFGGSVDFVIAWPVQSDLWKPEERGKSFAIASFVPLLGPALGPLIGGVITQNIGWRWIFWVTAISNGCLMLLGYFVIPETSAAKILGKKARKMSKESGKHHHTEYEGPNVKLPDKLWASITRPTRLLATQPILQLVSVFMAYNFGILYIFLSTFSSLFTSKYHQTASQSGYHYIALAIGYILASQVGGKVTDLLWARLKKRADGNTAPEYRVPLLVPGGMLIPIGLFWYGWSAQAKLHWIMPDIGAAIFGCGIITNTQAMAAYILDSFEKYSSSATAASQVLRMTAGFAFPIFAPALYHRLDWGWGNSVLAFIALAFCLPAPAMLWMFGAKLRAMGKLQ